jgi:hypothetical protein
MADRKVGAGRGSVYAGGKVYLEGSTIPSDVQVGSHVFTDATDDSAGQAVNQVVVVGGGDGGDGSLTAGSIDAVMERVGDDVDKARAALAEEEARSKPRSSLLEKLQALINDAS